MPVTIARVRSPVDPPMSRWLPGIRVGTVFVTRHPEIWISFGSVLKGGSKSFISTEKILLAEFEAAGFSLIYSVVKSLQPGEPGAVNLTMPLMNGAG